MQKQRNLLEELHKKNLALIKRVEELLQERDNLKRQITRLEARLNQSCMNCRYLNEENNLCVNMNSRYGSCTGKENYKCAFWDERSN